MTDYASVLRIAGTCYRCNQDKDEVLGDTAAWAFNPSNEDLERAYDELERDKEASLKDGRTVTLGVDRGRWVINKFGEPEFIEEEDGEDAESI